MKLADPSLHLALLDEIQPAYAWVGEMQDAYEVARAEHPEWPSWAAMHDDEDAPKPSLEAFLLTLDVPDEALTGVTRLTLDNDREVYEYLHPSWWQDGDHFVIRDLSGLERCTALTYLHLGQGVTEGCSLRPLASLTGLTELWVCASSSRLRYEVRGGFPVQTTGNPPTTADCNAYQGNYLAWQMANNPGGAPSTTRPGNMPGRAGRAPAGAEPGTTTTAASSGAGGTNDE